VSAVTVPLPAFREQPRHRRRRAWPIAAWLLLLATLALIAWWGYKISLLNGGL
jgi:TRAP-type C4-dicarboxylate transport system permease small subunit